MTAERIDGKAFAARLRERVAGAVPAFTAEMGRAPGLAVVLIGEDPASQIYVRSKNKARVVAVMACFEHRLPDTTTQYELIALVDGATPEGATPEGAGSLTDALRDGCGNAESGRGYVRVTSELYPELEAWYEERAGEWYARQPDASEWIGEREDER